MKRSVLSLLLVLIIRDFGSGFVRDESGCSGKEALGNLIRIVERKYPGFSEKTKDTLLYESFKKQLMEQAKTIPGKEVPKLLANYLGFFKDHHLFIGEKHPVQQTETIRRSAKLDIAMEDFMKRIETSHDDLEGIWTSDGYKVGIVKDGDEHKAFIIEADPNWWLPFEIKFVIHDAGTMTFRMRDHSETVSAYAVIDKAILHVKNLDTAFVKEAPKPDIPTEILRAKANEIEGFFCQPLSERTVLLGIASFSPYEISRIQKLIDNHKSLLTSRDNLIIDVRDNPGGSSEAFLPLLPLVYTNPMRELGIEFLATPALIDLFKEDFATYSGEELESLKKFVRRLEENLGSFVRDELNNVIIRTQNSVLAKPKNVVILMNKGCASATEQFLFLARQSKKVKLAGTTSDGALDYGGCLEFDFGCPEYALTMPTNRNLRLPDYPIDNIGIQPDIYLDASIDDWIKFAVKYLEK